MTRTLLTAFDVLVLRHMTVTGGHSARSIARVLYPEASGRYAGAVGRTLARLADRGLVSYSRRKGWHKRPLAANVSR